MELIWIAHLAFCVFEAEEKCLGFSLHNSYLFVAPQPCSPTSKKVRFVTLAYVRSSLLLKECEKYDVFHLLPVPAIGLNVSSWETNLSTEDLALRASCWSGTSWPWGCSDTTSGLLTPALEWRDKNRVTICSSSQIKEKWIVLSFKVRRRTILKNSKLPLNTKCCYLGLDNCPKVEIQ